MACTEGDPTPPATITPQTVQLLQKSHIRLLLACSIKFSHFNKRLVT